MDSPEEQTEKPIPQFETFFQKPYEELQTSLEQAVEDNQEIIDVGCNTGDTALRIDKLASNCHVICVDINEKALAELSKQQLEHTKVDTVQSDANEFLRNAASESADLIVVNATVHETNDPKKQAEYLNFFFTEVKRILKPHGAIVIGDYYYADGVTNEEIKDHRRYQMQAIGHADTPDKFIKPSLIMAQAIKHGFNMERISDIRAVKEIDRRYYNFIFRNQPSNS